LIEYGNHSVQLHIKGPWYYYLIPSPLPGSITVVLCKGIWTFGPVQVNSLKLLTRDFPIRNGEVIAVV